MGLDAAKRFVAGQRWASSTEPELGLGIVVNTEGYQVQIFFPGSDELRVYSIETAPLKRVRFAPGDEVLGHDGESLIVESVRDDGGLFTYVGSAGSLEESALSDNLSLDDPESRLLAGHVDETALFDLRLATHHHRQRSQASQVRGFTGARIELLPHQIYIAHEVSQRRVPRVLLADEVGLGKTIEASLILHRMIVCGLVSRALVLVPDALVHQWFVELLRRFNLKFVILDESNGDGEGYSENPFSDADFVLCGIDSLARDDKRSRQAQAAGWDILIVDEAHHLRWSEKEVSREYGLVEQFATLVPGLLLLTASPEQSGVASHFARLRLLDPARYPDFQRFVAEHESYAKVASQAQELIDGASEEELHDLLDRHGPGRVMFRNTRAAMPSFPKRIPQLVSLEPRPDGLDPKAEWLVGFLRQNPELKVFVICHAATEVEKLHERLRSLISMDIALFHEGLPLLQCDRQAAWFAEPDGPRVLISSGIGGEGRNFQFVNHMVLLDVPDDPECVEQRIGRLDRIGQVRDIHIHVPYIAGSREEGLVRWLHEGLDAFATPMVCGYRMLLEFADRLGDVTDELIVETKRYHQKLCREIAAGRDRLLELNSCRPAVADKLVGMIEEADSDHALEAYMSKVYEQFGVGVETLRPNDYLLRPELLYCEELPLPRDSRRITYDRSYALERPTVTLLSWDHPMVRGAMDMILGADRGACAVSRSAEATQRSVQAVFVLEAISSHRAAVSRFLPSTPIVVQINESMEFESELPALDGDGDAWMVREDLKFRKEVFPEMMSALRCRAEALAKETVENALAAMQQDLGSELSRLKELREINDHVRPDEIEESASMAEDFKNAINGARIRLDSIRLIIGPAE